MTRTSTSTRSTGNRSTASRPRPGPKRPHGATTRRTSTSRTATRRTTTSRSAVPEEQAPRRSLDPRESRRWWMVVAVLAVVGSLFALFEAPFFEARRAQISGMSRTSEGAILDALAIPEDQALATYSTGEARDRVVQLPWVESASVIRQWPSTVRVVVREHEVVAAAGDSSGRQWVVLGADRVALEERLTPPAGVPLIVTPASTIEAVTIGEPLESIERAYSMALDVPDQLQPWITTWNVDGDGTVRANLVGSAIVDFGIEEDDRTQFVSLASILSGGASRTCLREIDLAIADTPVIHRDSDCLLVSRQLDS